MTAERSSRGARSASRRGGRRLVLCAIGWSARPRRNPLSLLLLSFIFAVSAVSPLGCAKPTGPVFEPMGTPLVWPRPPARARIEFVGTLATDRDLKPGRSLAESIGRFLFGEREVESMVSPYSIASDDAGRAFVCDSERRVVHVFDLESRRYEQWEPSRKPRRGFRHPIGLCWHPDGRLYVADAAAGTIFTFDSRGNPLGEIGGEHITRPCGLALDVQRGRLYVADPAEHRVVVLDERGELLHRLGVRGKGQGEFNFPTDVAVDSVGRLYVSDSMNFRVQVFDTDLNFTRQIGRRGNTPGHFSQPKGLALDSDDHLYIVDAHFESVQIFDSSGRLLLHFGSEGTGPGQFWLPAGMHIDQEDRIWVADSYNRRVQVFRYLGATDPDVPETEDAP